MTLAAIPEWRIEEHPSLPSTQQLLKERLAAGADVDGLVVRAFEQREGRGRRGNGWASAPGGSYQSFAVQDNWGGRLLRPSITLLLAIELAEGLREAGAQVTVKWPNDLYLGEGKLAGILTEYHRGHLLVGVGVNVANAVPPAAARLTGWDLSAVNALVLRAARQALRAVTVGDDPGGEQMPARLAPLDHLSGRTVTVVGPGGNTVGVASGVRPDGALLVNVGADREAVVEGRITHWGPRRPR